ncbi:hypothetical protein [Terriglobus sp. TAA 43]|uniref:hypothetical protein n=1 Tax=Terriglobus sp. TAA 43 TaxID=278961 RepID=UPI000646D3EC|nr:hypothetical protein [Terriglobus sp. TAA 43]
MKRFHIFVIALVMPFVALAQDHVLGSASKSVIPELRGDRHNLDRDLQIALRTFSGQNSLDMRNRSVGVVDRPIAGTLHTNASTDVIAEGVVLRTDAYLAPDKNSMVTILTVLPTVILKAPAGFPNSPTGSNRSSVRHRDVLPAAPPPPSQGSTLRFALAGGTVYFDDNNGATVRQTGVRYPGPGENLVFFGQTIVGGPSDPPSAVLLLRSACSPQDHTCASIDGNVANSDALMARLPYGIATVQAYNATGAAIADASREGIRGWAASLEVHYNVGQGDIRKLSGPEIDIPPFTPSAMDESFVRAHILRSDAHLTTGGLGVVTNSVAAVDKVYQGLQPRERTIDVTQRGGLLWKDSSVVMAALTPTQQPLVEGGDYFLTVGRTLDNRWELRAAWRVVDDQVFALDRPRSVAVSHDGGSYWKSTALFLKSHGLQ